MSHLTINDRHKLFPNSWYYPRLIDNQLLFFTVKSSIRNCCAIVSPVTEENSTHYYKSFIKFRVNILYIYNLSPWLNCLLFFRFNKLQNSSSTPNIITATSVKRTAEHAIKMLFFSSESGLNKNCRFVLYNRKNNPRVCL